jgi:thiamine biosynthesis lipoprotein
LDLVDQLEAQLTVFRDDSEISRINQTAHLAPVQLEPRLFALFELAAQIHNETGGAYDIATGPLTKLWGFYGRQGKIPAAVELNRVLQHVGLRHVHLEHSRQTVQFDTPGLEFNLGSIGKGYALDRMAELLRQQGIERFLLHGGNSSVLAHNRGDGDKQNNHEWRIGLLHPQHAELRIGDICLRNRALGTSGSGTQFFISDGRRFGHILDPRCGWPAENTLSATVAAPTAAEADALATAFYVMGAAAAVEYCRRHNGISAVIMSPTAVAGRVEIALYGWADDEVRIDADDSLLISRIAD